MTDKVVDCIGLYCPVPIAEAAAAIEEVSSGDTIKVLADDPGVESDFPNWCKVTGHELVSLEPTEEGYEIVIRKK
ncbi:MAG: sulfurtransferase TusA family protein [Candidatus Coatesbacteria bacterium]|nr:MAG: sulfurtransferase TusA family protein [Candidatus Coatesbacteria bacterium]